MLCSLNVFVHMCVCVYACKLDVPTPALVQSSTGLLSKSNSFIVSAFPIFVVCTHEAAVAGFGSVSLEW